MTKSNGGRQGLFQFSSLCHSTSLSFESQGRNSKQESGDKNWGRGNMNAAYWLAPMAYPACFLIQLWTICPGVAPPLKGWALPYQSLCQKYDPLTCLPTIWWRRFLSWGSSSQERKTSWQKRTTRTSNVTPLINPYCPQHKMSLSWELTGWILLLSLPWKAMHILISPALPVSYDALSQAAIFVLCSAPFLTWLGPS